MGSLKQLCIGGDPAPEGVKWRPWGRLGAVTFSKVIAILSPWYLISELANTMAKMWHPVYSNHPLRSTKTWSCWNTCQLAIVEYGARSAYSKLLSLLESVVDQKHQPQRSTLGFMRWSLDWIILQATYNWEAPLMMGLMGLMWLMWLENSGEIWI